MRVPKHVAVIMDGNRRFGRMAWGSAQGSLGRGEVLLDFVQWCQEDGIHIVTVYAFSTENWSRDAVEIDLLMTMFGKYATTMAEEQANATLSEDFEHRLQATTTACTKVC